jgi:prolipoprotein diacylglyceryltransferase
MGVWVLAASLAGARLSYAITNSEYFSTHLAEIPQVWLGGLTWPGAVAGAWLAVLVLPLAFRGSRGSRITLGWLADRLYPLLPPLAIGTWLGGWLTGVAYGARLPDGAWWAVPSLDDTGAVNPHFPLQFLAVLSLFAFFWLLELRLQGSRTTGLVSGLAVFGLFIHLLLVSLLRADPGRVWNGLRADAWIAFIYLALFSLMVLANAIATRLWRKPQGPGLPAQAAPVES